MESIEKIKQELCLDECEAIRLTNIDTKDFERNSDYFKDWYEEELKIIYTADMF